MPVNLAVFLVNSMIGIPFEYSSIPLTLLLNYIYIVGRAWFRTPLHLNKEAGNGLNYQGIVDILMLNS